MTLLSLAFCLLTLLGVYLSHYKGDSYKVRITRNDNGTYRAQVIWVLHDINPETGEKWLDVRNPDKRLRFLDDGRLAVRGSVMGIGQTIYWERIEYSAGFENFQ